VRIVEWLILTKLSKDMSGHEKPFLEVEILQNGVLTGKDIGVGSFEQGRFLFSGFRSAFEIGTQDITRIPDVIEPTFSSYLIRKFVLDIPKEQLSIRIWHYEYLDFTTTGHYTTKLRKAIVEWANSDLSAVSTKLPPKSMLPDSVVTPAKIALQVLLLLIAISVGCLCLKFILSSSLDRQHGMNWAFLCLSFSHGIRVLGRIRSMSNTYQSQRRLMGSGLVSLSRTA
jgi:hypothetical protein